MCSNKLISAAIQPTNFATNPGSSLALNGRGPATSNQTKFVTKFCCPSTRFDWIFYAMAAHFNLLRILFLKLKLCILKRRYIHLKTHVVKVVFENFIFAFT